jgi:hypothetical protein
VVTVTADAGRLRQLAFAAARLPDFWSAGQSYMEVGWPTGEVQIWREYHRMVSIARTARGDVLADPGPATLEPAIVRERVRVRGVVVRRRRYGPPREG